MFYRSALRIFIQHGVELKTLEGGELVESGGLAEFLVVIKLSTFKYSSIHILGFTKLPTWPVVLFFCSIILAFSLWKTIFFYFFIRRMRPW